LDDDNFNNPYFKKDIKKMMNENKDQTKTNSHIVKQSFEMQK